MNIEWDAKKYTDDFSFVPQYGAGVIDLIDLTKARTCLDLGCGNGALTAELQRRGLRVTGLDASPELLQIARAQHPDIPFMEADAASFALREPVDAVFSNAVFHWIDRERQMAMLSCVKKALRPGGQFVFEFGGKGNTALIHSALAAAFSARGHAYRMPFYFPSIGEYASLVEKAGFTVRAAWLFDRPTELKGEDGMADWIRLFVRTPFAAVPAAAEKEAIIREAVDLLRPQLYRDGRWYADYVRLRMKAVNEA